MSIERPRVYLSSILLMVFCTAGCGFSWTTRYTSRAPDRDAVLRVEVSNCFADCAVRVVVKQGWKMETFASATDCVVNFAHAVWQQDRVAVFVDGGYCGQIKAAYDLSTHGDRL